MKSKLIFCILLALALTLSACKSEKSETTASTETVSATTAAPAPAPTAPPGATATIPVAVQPPVTSAPSPGSPAVTGTNVGASPIVVTQTQVPASPLQAMDTLLATIPRVSPEEAKQEIDKGQAIIVDVRGAAYQTGHVKGALDIPEAQIPFKMAELPKDKKIITYCTWPNEETSARVALKLKQAGFTKVAAIEGGFHAWERAGYETATGQ